jgi:hypothetical protein
MRTFAPPYRGGEKEKNDEKEEYDPHNDLDHSESC